MMAAFWQWKAAEELEFPADCISFQEDDLPGAALATDCCQAVGAETVISNQCGIGETEGAETVISDPCGIGETECTKQFDSTTLKNSQLGTISCTIPAIFAPEDPAGESMNGGEKCSENGPVCEQHQEVTSSRNPRKTRENSIGGSEEQSDISDDVISPVRQGGESHESGSTSEEHRGLSFFGEAATRRPAYKYLVDLDHDLENRRVVSDSQRSDSQYLDSRTTDLGSNAVLEERALQKLQSPNGVPRTQVVTVEKTKVFLQNGVDWGGVEPSLGGWQRGEDNGDVMHEGGELSLGESVLSPSREETTATATPGESTPNPEDLYPRSLGSSTVRGNGKGERMHHADASPREEALGSSNKPTTAVDSTAVHPARETSTSAVHQNESLESPHVVSQREESAVGGVSELKPGSDTSALEEYLARGEECEGALEECENPPAVEAAAALREAVRRMREDAALLALKLSAVYVADTSNVRQTAQSLLQHVGAMQTEVQEVRTSLVAYMLRRGSLRTLLRDVLLSAIVFVAASEAPRLSRFLVRWLGIGRSPGTRLSWIQKGNLGSSLFSVLPKERWPLRWRLIVALGVFRALRFVDSVRQERARRVTAAALLGKWNQIAERLVILTAIAEGGLGTSESVQEAAEVHV